MTEQTVSQRKFSQNIRKFLFAKSVNTQKQSKRRKIVEYNDHDHFSVFFQMHGSVWPQVIRYCIANLILTTILWYFIKIKKYPWSLNPIGHNFAGVLVSFLLIGKVKTYYLRFMEINARLSDVLRSCRDLVHYAIALTMHDKEDGSVEWRREVRIHLCIQYVHILTLETKSENFIIFQKMIQIFCVFPVCRKIDCIQDHSITSWHYRSLGLPFKPS